MSVLTVDWVGAAAGLTRSRQRMGFGTGTYTAPGVAWLGVSRAGRLLAHGLTWTVHPVPLHSVYVDGRAYLRQGRQPLPEIAIRTLTAPTALVDEFVDRYKSVTDIGPDLAVDVDVDVDVDLGSGALPLRLVVERPLLQQVGTTVVGGNMSVATGVRLTAVAVWLD